MLEHVSGDVRAMLAAQDVQTEIQNYYEDLPDIIQNRDKYYYPISFAPTFNERIGGLPRGCLIVIGARPSNGKSAFLLNVLLDLAQQGKKCHFFSLEMSVRQCVERLFAMTTDMPLGYVQSQEFLKLMQTGNKFLTEKLSRMWQSLENVEFTVSDGYGKDYEQIIQLIEVHKHFDAIVIDYAQMINIRNKTQRESIDEYVKQLRQLAIDKNMCVILASQINRGAGDGTRIPGLHELKGCGALEEVTDVGIVLHRPYLYTKNDEEKNDIVVDIQKNRQGDVARFGMNFIGEKFKFLGA